MTTAKQSICWTPLEMHNIFINTDIILGQKKVSSRLFKGKNYPEQGLVFQEAVNTLPENRRRNVLLNGHTHNLLRAYTAWKKNHTLAKWWPSVTSSSFLVKNAKVKESMVEWNNVIKGTLPIEKLVHPYRTTANSYGRPKAVKPVIDTTTTQAVERALKEGNDAIMKKIDVAMSSKKASPVTKRSNDKVNVSLADIKRIVRAIVKEEFNLLVLSHPVLGKK